MGQLYLLDRGIIMERMLRNKPTQSAQTPEVIEAYKAHKVAAI